MLLVTALSAAPVAAAPETASDHSLTTLVQGLATADNEAMAFEETRPSRLLAEPLTVSGILYRDDQRLVRETTSPRSETQILSEDHFEVRRPGGFRQRFSLGRAPELAALRQALLAMLDGDVDRLDSHFSHDLNWDDEVWTLTLRPVDTAMAERIDQLTLSGHAQQLESMTLILADGDRIHTRFLGQP